MVPGTAGPSKPEGLAFDKSISRLLYPGLEIGHMASTRVLWLVLKRPMEFECGKVGLGTSMKHASVPIWNVRLVWLLGLRESASVDAHAGLKHFTTCRSPLLVLMTDAETKAGELLLLSKQSEKSLKSRRNCIAALMWISQLGFSCFIIHANVTSSLSQSK
jgi:hypothetical protein